MTRALAITGLAMLTIGAGPPAALDQPSYTEPSAAWRDVEDAQARCRDRIDHARAEAGKPKLEREPADPDKPMLIYAMDHRVDGCGVIVPVGDPADIRPSPEPGPPQIVPAR